MRARSCTIYGFDGFDLDVAHNLIPLYRSMGLRPALSSELRPADLLVLQRAPDRGLDLRPFGAVHLWDYVGTPIAELLRSSRGAERLTVFTSSAERAARLAPAAAESGARVVTQLAPVRTRTWVAPPAPRRFEAVHIGNFKPFYREGDDLYAQRFLATIRQTGAEVWGNGWDGVVSAPRGTLGLFRVAAVYAASGSALGMMYPFQRSVSFSGRFWHAPLNGCTLLSEPSVYAGEWPGVRATDYSSQDVAAALGAPSPSLREEARAFWDEHWDVSSAVVAADIERRPDEKHIRSSVFDLGSTMARSAVHRFRR